MKFYSSSTNSRGNEIGTAGKCGGQTTHSRTWTHGVRVISKLGVNNEPEFHIYATTGSNGSGSDDSYLGVVYYTEAGVNFSAANNLQLV